MARIPNDEIERLKKEISIERLVLARGVKLAKHGDGLVGLCPFHEDRTPSLVVSPDKNLWHCLGACQTGGSVIDWVMKAEGVSFRHAVELLRENIPSLIASPNPPPARVAKRSSVKKLEPPVATSASDDELLLSVAAYYHETLKQSPEALAYLEKRGLKSAEMIEHFKLGYANRTLGYRLPDKNRKEGAELRGALQRVGIVRESGHEHLNGSLVIPIFDEHGRVTEMYGRKITEGLRPGTPLHLYLPGPHRGIFNREALSSNELIVCEALIDALTFWSAGYRNVTTAYGVEGFTSELREAIRAAGTQRVFIAYDRDEAGDRAANKLAEELMTEGIECFRVLFPKNMDANEYALKLAPAEKSLGLVLRNAEWMGKGAEPSRDRKAAKKEEAFPETDEPIVEHERSVPESEPTSLQQEGAASTDAEAGDQPNRHDDQTMQESTVPARAEPHIAAAPEPILPLAASPRAAPAPAAESSDDEVLLRFGDRRWRVRGLDKNASVEAMKVNVLVGRDTGAFHVDTLELYSARHRAAFLRSASDEIDTHEDVLKREMGAVLLELERRQEERLKKLREPMSKKVEISEPDQEAALELLRDPNLLERILQDFERCGIVGEKTNILVGYLAATSRRLDEPLAVVLQSSSAAGKSRVMDAVLDFMPEEERLSYSAMTGQSLFYMGEQDLAHKILAIVEEEGAERASYALKLLQSEGELTIASTGKDPATGRLVTNEYKVTGPVMILLTTTAIDVDEELLNRCLVLTVDEGREQTRAIHARQRAAQTLEGLFARREKEHILAVHRNAQRLIRPLVVVNPFAKDLGFLDHATRTRRDHMKYLTLIRTIALLRQYQRPVKSVEHGGETVRYIEVNRDDIEAANKLCHEVLGRSLDELPPQTRRLLELLFAMVAEAATKGAIDASDVRFTRRAVREKTGWSAEQLRVHLGRLVELEYVVAHRGKSGQSFVYQLCYDGKGASGERFMVGLFDGGTTSTLGGSEGNPPGSRGNLPGSNRAETGAVPGGYRAGVSARSSRESKEISSSPPIAVQKQHIRNGGNGAVPYTQLSSSESALEAK